MHVGVVVPVQRTQAGKIGRRGFYFGRRRDLVFVVDAALFFVDRYGFFSCVNNDFSVGRSPLLLLFLLFPWERRCQTSRDWNCRQRDFRRCRCRPHCHFRCHLRNCRYRSHPSHRRRPDKPNAAPPTGATAIVSTIMLRPRIVEMLISTSGFNTALQYVVRMAGKHGYSGGPEASFPAWRGHTAFRIYMDDSLRRAQVPREVRPLLLQLGPRSDLSQTKSPNSRSWRDICLTRYWNEVILQFDELTCRRNSGRPIPRLLVRPHELIKRWNSQSLARAVPAYGRRCVAGRDGVGRCIRHQPDRRRGDPKIQRHRLPFTSTAVIAPPVA